MSTEYRRGIPSTAHIEAAMRLGLEWRRESHSRGDFLTRFRYVDGQPHSNFATYPELDDYLTPISSDERSYAYRPIRPDGTPVDWEVLDQEVARVGQQGQPQTMACNLTAPEQPQGFRADLWRRIREFIYSTQMNSLGDIADVNAEGIVGESAFLSDRYLFRWQAMGLHPDSSEVQTQIARWTVYQELKPLYDLVDGAQGEAAMPEDVEAEWHLQATTETDPLAEGGRLGRDAEGLYLQCRVRLIWRPSEDIYGVPLRNFAAVLDAVAERRVAERMRGQTQAPTVTSERRVNVEPRRFADVRPDRHGWRWWQIVGAPDAGIVGARFEAMSVGLWCWLAMADGAVPTGSLTRGQAWARIDSIWNPRTVIPTDEQGNPVSWDSIGQGRSAGQTLIYVDDITTQAPSAQELCTAWDSINKTLLPPTQPLPLPRFTTDELDDVDHSKTTKLDEVTLRRGKLPTVEQIAKYREVRARRTGGTVGDALKESRIDCEVAQYVLERWAGGLGDEEAHDLIHSTATLRVVVKGVVHIKAVDNRVVSVLSNCYSLDTSEKPSPTVQRARQEAEAERQRLAELRLRLAAERAAQPQEMAKESDAVSRFDLIEPDPQADPAASIRAWEAHQAAAKVRPVATPPRIAKPVAAPRRPAIEVVDAEVDGLSRVEAVTALFGRALNGGC